MPKEIIILMIDTYLRHLSSSSCQLLCYSTKYSLVLCDVSVHTHNFYQGSHLCWLPWLPVW